MNRFLVPGQCADCHSQVQGLARCATCGLPQTGELAVELQRCLGYADHLLGLLHQAPRPAPQPALQPTPAVASQPVAEPQPPRAPAPSPVRHLLPAASVPVILLGLGAVCVLVAAIVFVAVAWSDLSLGWRTTILLSVTAVATAAAVWVLRQGLRGAAEALTLVSSGLVALALVAGDGAGLPVISALDGTAFGWLVALILLVTGLGWSLAAQRTRTRALVGQQVVVVLAACAMVGLGALDWATGWDYPLVWLSAVVAVLAVGAALALRRLDLPVAAVPVAGLAGLAWLFLVGDGLTRALAADGARALFLELRGAPLLVAAAMAAVPAVVRRLDLRLRTGAAVAALAGPVVVLLLPVRELDPTTAVLVVAASALALAAGALAVAAPWRQAARVVGVGTALYPAFVLTSGVVLVLSRLALSALDAWTRDLDAALAAPAPVGSLGSLPVSAPDPVWVLVPVAVLLAATAACATGHAARQPRTGLLAVTGAAGAGAVTASLLTSWSLLVLGLLLVGAAVAAVGAWARTGALAWLAAAGVLSGLGLAAAVPSLAATGAFFAAHGALALGLAWLLRDAVVRAALTGGAVAVLAVSVEAFGRLGGLSVSTRGLVLVGFAAAVALLAQLAPRLAQPRTARAAQAVRAALELVAAGVGAVAVSTLLADGLALTVALTAAGVTVVLVSLLSTDRRHAAWAGSVLLVLASWVRLADVEVQVVEAYTLPGAVALLVAGVVRLRRTPGATSWRALSAPLGLGLVPSLLVALDQPTSPRALLVGLAGLVLIGLALTLRWGAPLLAGAATVAALAVVNVAPYAAGLPRWVLFGTAGVALLALGVSWERRRQDVTAVSRYVTGLR